MGEMNACQASNLREDLVVGAREISLFRKVPHQFVCVCVCTCSCVIFVLCLFFMQEDRVGFLFGLPQT